MLISFQNSIQNGFIRIGMVLSLHILPPLPPPSIAPGTAENSATDTCVGMTSLESRTLPTVQWGIGGGGGREEGERMDV